MNVMFMEKMDDTRQKLRKLKPFIGKRADALWIRYNSGGQDEKYDLLEIINLLLHKYDIESIEDQVVLPPPVLKEAEGDIPVGKIQYLNRPTYDLGIQFSELTRHTGIFGSTGTGKTTLAKNILREMVQKNIPFIVFDWERNYRNLIKEYPQIKVFTIGSDTAPFFFNYLKIPPDLSYKDYIKNVIEVFNRAYIGGVGSDSILLKVFDEAYREHQMPTTEDARIILAGNMTGKKMRGREMLWKQSSLRMLEFLSYGGTGKVYNVKDFYPIERLEKDFVIFELGALANSNDKRFFVEMFTLWYWLYKEHQGIEHETLKHVMVFEEFHNIVDNSQKDDLIQKIFRQIRKYGTGLIIIDQTPSLIPNPVFENLYTKITFSLNHRRNVDAVANAMNMDREERKFIGMLNTGKAICRLMGRYIHPFLIQVPFVENSLNCFDNEIQSHMQGFYKDYTPTSPQITEQRPLRIPTNKFIPSPLERIFLQDLIQHPLDGADKRAKRLGLVPRDASNIQKNLVENEILTPVVVDRKKLFEITKNGQNELIKIGFKIIHDGSQGIEHRYFLDQIGQLFIQSGWMTFKEKDDIDLVVEKTDEIIAMECETGKNNNQQIIKNMEKLLHYNADKKYIIATNEIAYNKIKIILSNIDLPDKTILQVFMARDFINNFPFKSCSHP